jgi:hypothetical protein
MWQTFVSETPLKTNIFRTIEEARTWLEDCAG